MQTPKTTRNWALAAAVAAMLTASTAAVRAQDANANPTTAPGTTTTTPDTSATGATTAPGTAGAPGTGVGGAAPMAPSTGTTPAATGGNMSSMPMSGSMGSGSMSNGGMDYSILSNPNFDYVDIQQAKARGLSDSQIATVAKIATETYMPFGEVARAVERGQTFPSLAAEYNLKLADVYDVDKEKQKISDYTAAYESLTMKNGSTSGTMDSSMPMAPAPAPMSGGAAPMPMAPADTSTPPAMATMDIVDTAMAAKNLTTLVKALQTAGLVETLKGAGPFTVFAPDDKAFSRLPAGALDALLADPAKLKTILTYHVIPASIMASDAMNMTSPTSPPTVQGGTLQVTVTKGRRSRVKINDATVTKADIKASNGVIHIIDRVLMPPMDMAAPATGATGTSTDTNGAAAAGTTGTATTPGTTPGTTATGSGTDTTGGTTPPATPPAAPAPAPAQ